MKWLVYGLLVALAIAHQDLWNWDDSDTLVFGVVPIGLAYHAGLSIAAAVLWAAAVKFCWPVGVDSVEEIRATDVERDTR
jgi:hypothetical protein